MIKVDEEDPVGELDPSFPFRDVVVRRNTDVKEYYNLEEEIGRGKFGTVFRCHEKKTGLTLAAKFVGIARRQDRKNVEREVEIMRTLQHPRLIQLYDAFESANVMCVVLELIEGGELFERVIDDDFILTERACTVFMRQICEGVQFIHSKNIIHLDLKPENILCLTKTGNRIKIIDFGLARKHEPDKKLQVLFGTPEFVAPEVVNFDQISFATDMWSVGVICYVLLSGLSPFMGETDIETMANVTVAQYDFDDEAFDDISDTAKDFIGSLLVKDKEARFTATQCLSHPWLRRKTPPLPPSLITTKDNLRNFVDRYITSPTEILESSIIEKPSARVIQSLLQHPMPNVERNLSQHELNDKHILREEISNGMINDDLTTKLNNTINKNMLSHVSDRLEENIQNNNKSLTNIDIGTSELIPEIKNQQFVSNNAPSSKVSTLPSIVITDTPLDNASIPTNENISNKQVYNYANVNICDLIDASKLVSGKTDVTEGERPITAKEKTVMEVNLGRISDSQENKDQVLLNAAIQNKVVEPIIPAAQKPLDVVKVEEHEPCVIKEPNIALNKQEGVKEETKKVLESPHVPFTPKSETKNYLNTTSSKSITNVLDDICKVTGPVVVKAGTPGESTLKEDSFKEKRFVNSYTPRTSLKDGIDLRPSKILSPNPNPKIHGIVLGQSSHSEDNVGQKKVDIGTAVKEAHADSPKINVEHKEYIKQHSKETESSNIIETVKESITTTHKMLKSTAPWFSESHHTSVDTIAPPFEKIDRRASDISCYLHDEEDSEGVNLAEEIRKLSARLFQMSNRRNSSQDDILGNERRDSLPSVSHRRDPITEFLATHGVLPSRRPKYKFSIFNRDVPIGSPPPPSNVAYYMTHNLPRPTTGQDFNSASATVSKKFENESQFRRFYDNQENVSQVQGEKSSIDSLASYFKSTKTETKKSISYSSTK